MSAISLCLTIHEPYALRRFTVFDVDEKTLYEDDDKSCQQAMYVARTCYLPTLEILYRHLQNLGDAFSVALSVSTSALDLFEQYTPEVIDNLKKLAATGQVEFLGEAGSHSLALLYSRDEFVHQLTEHSKRIEGLFGRKPTTFRNPELLFNDEVATTIAPLGFTAALTEGSPQILGWRNANYVYASDAEPSVRLLLRNPELSRNISQNFSNRNWNGWPLTAEKFADQCEGQQKTADILNIFLDFHAFGLRNTKESGIFDFLQALPGAVLAKKNLTFLTPGQMAERYEVKDSLAIPGYISWNDEGSDIRGWLGNEMQKDAIETVYQHAARVRRVKDPELTATFERLQTSDYFHYMSTRWFSESQPDRPNPYLSPYDAYISYMNILEDFSHRLLEKERERAKEKELADAAIAPKAAGAADDPAQNSRKGASQGAEASVETKATSVRKSQ